ncbi:MAG: hypothetical protein WCI71_09025 [Bacteroidota bacterium]
MSNSKTNALTKNYKGKFGNQFVLRNRHGKSMMGKIPEPSSKEPTAKQIVVKDRFLAATDYARRILMNPVYRQLYAERGAGVRSAYNVAVANYLKPPKVTEIDHTGYHGLAGDQIRVTAIDLFKVMRVMVSLRDAANGELEFGDCVQEQDGSAWIYTVKADHTPVAGQAVKAVAYDLPGHYGELTSPVS